MRACAGWAFAYGDKQSCDDSGTCVSVGNPFIGTTNFAMWPTQEASYATFYFQYVVRAPAPAASYTGSGSLRLQGTCRAQHHQPGASGWAAAVTVAQAANSLQYVAQHPLSNGRCASSPAAIQNGWMPREMHVPACCAQFAISTATIVSGAVAERVKFIAYACYAFFLTAWVSKH
jgi:hypothetical protein